MPRKAKKKSAADTDADGSKEKRAKRERRLDDKVSWQVEDRPGKWVLFDDDTQKALSEAYNDGKAQCDIDDGEFIVDFEKPIRKTVKTGYQKRVRVGFLDNDNQVYTWSWKDGREKLHYYGIQSTFEIEDNSEATELEVSSEGKPFTVNVKERKHTKRFEMLRDVADAEEAPKKVQVTSSTAKKSATKLNEKTEKMEKMETEVKHEKTVVVKGKAPVDSECGELLGKVHVHYDGSDVWDCMLNQTNLQNNNNKYYLIQLLKEDNRNKYYVWMRWGRVGKKGQHDLISSTDLDDAKLVFCAKFKDKTRNDWYKRKDFVKFSGKYDLLEMDYSTEDTVDSVKDVKKSKPNTSAPASKLSKSLQELIDLICDVKAMEEAVVEMKYDAKKAPLGKLTKGQIKAGYEALKHIEELIKAGQFGFQLTEACNDFYTRIPHDFGMRPPEKITDMKTLKLKLSLLEALGDIEIAVKILKSGDHSINPLDRHYSALECDLNPMDKLDSTYQVLENYLQHTHASTHAQYTMELVDVYECNKKGQPLPPVGNRMLLWHGSRLTNWVGILAKGLRIAPPEAPVTGYMFGKGIYFADCSSKSANYCFATKHKNIGLLLLCEVALGDQNELLSANYQANKLPKGKNSVKGCGKTAPDPAGYVTLDDGVVVPCGKLKDTGINNPTGYTLMYNEYIVYDTSQVRMRYLAKVKFNFKY